MCERICVLETLCGFRMDVRILDAATDIQRTTRGHLARRRVHTHDRAVKCIAALLHRHVAKNRMIRLRHRVSTIQAAARGVAVRRTPLGRAISALCSEYRANRELELLVLRCMMFSPVVPQS